MSWIKSVFIEKYRPKSLDEIAGQDHIVRWLKQFVKHGDFPNLLFVGQPGTGKTTTAIALARELYGKDWIHNFMEINASDETGVDTVRTKIKDYASIVPYGEAKFKILLLDEADYLTPNAQAALRRVIEKASEVCRFIFSCNYPNRIISAIADRCVVFRFKPLSTHHLKQLIQTICEKEDIKITPEAANMLAIKSKGSARTALNILNTVKFGGISEIDKDTVYNVIGMVDYYQILNLYQLLKNSADFKTIDQVLTKLLFDRAYTTDEILENLLSILKEDEEVSNSTRLNLIKWLSEIDYRISQGANPYIQLRTLMVIMVEELGKGGKGSLSPGGFLTTVQPTSFPSPNSFSTIQTDVE